MGNIEQFGGDAVDPLVGADFAARRTEARLARKGHNPFVAANRTHIARVAGLGVATAHHFLDGFADVGMLVSGDIFFVEVEPAVPMVDEDLPKTVASVGPVQYSGLGPDDAVAKRNALALAAKEVAKTIVHQMNAKGLN